MRKVKKSSGYRKKGTNSDMADVLDTSLVDAALPKKLTPLRRLVVKNFIRYNGSVSAAARASRITPAYATKLLNDPKIKKTLVKSFKVLGLDLFYVGRVLKRVMDRKGDFHYDFNRLRAVDMFCKLVGAYAPKQVEVSGEISTKHEVRALLVKMVKTLKDSDEESKKQIEVKSSVQ